MHVGRYKCMAPHSTHAMSRMTIRGEELTENESQLVGALDDTAEHVAFEFDPDEYVGPSTCGFAKITNIDGRWSFVKLVKSLQRSTVVDWVTLTRNGDYLIEIGNLELSLRKNDYQGCYELSISNTQELAHGPNFQRIDVQERLHRLVLTRLQHEWGYLENARVTSRID